MTNLRRANARWLRYSVFAVWALLQGCVVGVVTDAATGAPLNGVTVTLVDGTCSKVDGSRCASPTQTSRSITGLGLTFQGAYAFDWYGDLNGAANIQRVMPVSGREALGLRFSRVGYQTITVWHRPKYEEISDNGKQYDATVIPTVILCPTGAVDSDADGLCDLAEPRYGTDARNPDTDLDGLDDGFEVLGASGLDLASYGAKPNHRDVFLEVDFYRGNTDRGYIDLAPQSETIAKLESAFAAAPLPNADGAWGVALHVVVDTPIDPAIEDPDLHLHFPFSLFTLSDDWTEFDVIKNKYMNRTRSPAFHYALMAWDGSNTLGSFGGLSRGNPAHDFVLTSGTYSSDPQIQAVGIMHELGHNLGLTHGGSYDQIAVDSKPNYLSVMNYLYSGRGLLRDGVDTLDYSRHPLAAVDEASLSEPEGFTPIDGSAAAEAELARYGVRYCRSSTTFELVGIPFLICDDLGNLGEFTKPDGTPADASSNIDFDRDRELDTNAAVQADLNGNSNQSDVFSASQNDWDALYYCGNVFGGGALGAPGRPLRCETFTALESEGSVSGPCKRPLP